MLYNKQIKYSRSQMDDQVEYPDISNLAPNSFAMQCQSIRHAIFDLLSPAQEVRKAGEQYLQQLQYFDISNFVTRIVSIVTSAQMQSKDKHLCLCYLRHALSTHKNNMGDLVPQLSQLCQQCPDQLKETAVKCLVIYLNRPKNIQHRRAYIQNLIGSLSTYKNASIKGGNANTKIIDNKLLNSIINVLGDKSFTKKSGLNFSNANQKLIHEIIIKHSMDLPNQQVESSTWLSLILALSNYTGFTPPIQFIYNHITSRQLTTRQVAILSSMYNAIHCKFTIPEQVYNILLIQLERVRNTTLIQNICNNQSYIEAEIYAILLKNISNAATDLLRHFDIKQSGTTEHICQSKPHIYQSSFLTNLIIQVLYRPQEEEDEYQHLAIETVTDIILAYKLNVSVHGFMQDIWQALSQKKYGQEYMYLLICALPTSIVKQLDMNTIISRGVQAFIDPISNALNINDSNASIYRLQCLLKMINTYMKSSNLTYPSNTQQELSAIINSIMSSILASTNMLVMTNALKAHAFAILCRFHINAHLDSEVKVENVQSVVAIGYQILISQTIINANDHIIFAMQSSPCVTDGQCTEIVVDSLKQLASTYKQHMYGCILNFLSASLVNSYQPQKIHIYGYFLEILHSCFQVSYIDSRLSAVLRQCYHSNNQALQYEASELVLTIAHRTNIFAKQNPQLQGFCQQVMTQLLTTGVLRYIQHNLIQQQDDILFTQILAELSIHEHIHEHIQNMLNRVCSNLPAWLQVQYNFDKIWEILIIVYKTNSQFPERKLINKKLQNIYSGNIQALLESVTIQDAEEIKQRHEKLNLSQHNRIMHWSHLPDVKRLIKQGSVVGQYVDGILEG